MHINNTNLPVHLEQMLKLLIEEENNSKKVSAADEAVVKPAPTDTNATTTTITAVELVDPNPDNECFQFVIANRPLDLLADICITDSPPGATILILNWIRRFLSCLQQPHFEHKSVYEIILKLLASIKDTAGKASPYEHEEIMFLLTVAGVVRKDPVLLNLFLPMHLHTMNNAVIAKDNTIVDNKTDAAADVHVEDVVDQTLRSVNSGEVVKEDDKLENSNEKLPCDCQQGNSLVLFDTIMLYFDSAVSNNAMICLHKWFWLPIQIRFFIIQQDSLIVVRACEAALILVSLPSMIADCCALELTLSNFCNKLAERVGDLCRAIPEDMDNGDIEDCIVSWGYVLDCWGSNFYRTF